MSPYRGCLACLYAASNVHIQLPDVRLAVVQSTCALANIMTAHKPCSFEELGGSLPQRGAGRHARTTDQPAGSVTGR